MGKPLLFISDGTVGSEVNLLDPKAIMVNGWKPKMPQLKGGGIYSNSALADGKELVIESYDDVIEEMPLFIGGKDPDQIGAVQHVLFDLLRTLRGYFTRAERETTPVYLGWRPKDQTNIQYAPLKNYSFDTDTEGFGHEIKGSLFKPATLAGILNLERETWRSHAPGTLPNPISISHPDLPETSGTLVYVPNHRNNFSLTHIYNYDDSAASFSANQIANAAFTYFPSPAGVQDIVYFGSDQGPFFNIVHNIGVTGNFNGTIVPEYWNGAAWTTAANYIAAYLPWWATMVNTKTGRIPIRFNAPSNWTRTVINGVNAYWLRIRITVFTSMGTNPTNADQVVYTANDEYLEFDSNDLVGDLPALLRAELYNASKDITSTNTQYINSIAIGAKSRGLTNFTSRLNWASQNPAGWSTSLGIGALVSQDGSSPSGDRIGIGFGTATNQVRAQLQLSVGVGQNARVRDFEGTYQAYVVCNQVGGSAGDVAIQLIIDWNLGVIGNLITDQVKLTRVGNDHEFVNLGRIRIPPSGSFDLSGYNSPSGLDIRLYAQSSNGATPTLFLYELILFPIDEWSIVLRDAEVSRPASTLTTWNAQFGPTRVVADAGLLEKSVALDYFDTLISSSVSGDNPSRVATWEPRGVLPELMPNRRTRLYFMFGQYPINVNTGAMVKPAGGGTMARFYAHNRWLGFRGDE